MHVFMENGSAPYSVTVNSLVLFRPSFGSNILIIKKSESFSGTHS